MQKGFFIYGIVAGAMFVLIALYIFILDTSLHTNLGKTKANLLGGAMLAYGAFRIWRAYKIKNNS